jgi:hypothetical protein
MAAYRVALAHGAKGNGYKVIIAPDGSDAWAPPIRRPEETPIRTLARAHRWKWMLEEGRHRSAGEIAEAGSLTRSFVNRMMLAPDIQEAIIDGRQPKGMQLEELTKPVPTGWQEQRSVPWSANTRWTRPRMTARRQHGSDVIRQAKLRLGWRGLS